VTAHELAKLLLAGPDLPLIHSDSEYGFSLFDGTLPEISRDSAIYDCNYGREAREALKQHERYISL